MEMWINLGIEKTKDVDTITEAYHEKLKLVHPEEKPEEFMALRTEYEEALAFAKECDDEQEREKTPIDLWLEKVGEIYGEFSRRTDLSQWRELFKDDVCRSLDSRTDARNALLGFAMKKNALPQDVWCLFDEEFSIKENREELYEIFPRDYIDECVISGMDNPPAVPYELFDENTTGDPDCYFELHYKARNEMRDGDLDSAEQTIADIEKTGIIHPYTRALYARLYMNRKDFDKALEIANELCEKYDSDDEIIYLRAGIFFNSGRYEEAMPDLEKLREMEHGQSRYIYAQCCTMTGRLTEAKDMLALLVHEYPFEQSLRQTFEDTCKKLIDQYDEKLADGTITVREMIDYAWSCLQSDDYDKSKELAQKIEPETVEDKCDLYNLCSKLYNSSDDAEKSLEYAKLWEEAVAQLPEADSEDGKDRKNKLYDIYYVQANSLAKLERYEEALEMTERSLEASDKRASECHDLRRIIFRRVYRDYEKALHEAELMTQVKPGSWPFFILGCEQYELGMLQSAFNSFGESIEYTRDLECYVYRIRILCDAEQYDGANEIIKYLEENGVEGDVLEYCNARVLEGEGKKEEALAKYLSIVENMENNQNSMFFPYEIYYRAAELAEDKSYEERLELVEKGLEHRDNCYDLLYLKTTLLENLDRPKEAIETYDKINLEYPGRYSFPIGYANNYYDLREYEKALEYYRLRCETNESAGVCDMIGLCLLYLGRYDEAKESFERAIELDENYVRAYTNLGFAYEYKFCFEEAVEAHRRASELNDRLDENARRRYVNRNLAKTLARVGRYDEAAQAYRKNLEMFDSNEDARYEIEVFIEAARLSEAAERITEHKEKERISEIQYLLMMADVYRLQGNQKLYYKTISKLPEDSSFRYERLGRYERHRGNFKKAMEYYGKVEEMKPEQLDMFDDRLVCMGRLGMTEEREKCFARFLEVMKERRWGKEEEALYVTKYALCYIAAGYPEKAKPYIDQALEMPLCEHCRYPKCKDAYLALAEYYEAVGEYDKAVETCAEANRFALDEYDFVYIADRIRKEHKKELKKENRK